MWHSLQYAFCVALSRALRWLRLQWLRWLPFHLMTPRRLDVVCVDTELWTLCVTLSRTSNLRGVLKCNTPPGRNNEHTNSLMNNARACALLLMQPKHSVLAGSSTLTTNTGSTIFDTRCACFGYPTIIASVPGLPHQVWEFTRRRCSCINCICS